MSGGSPVLAAPGRQRCRAHALHARRLPAPAARDPRSRRLWHLSWVLGRRSVGDTRSTTLQAVSWPATLEWHSRSRGGRTSAQRGGGGRPIMTAGPCVSVPRC